MRRALRVEYKWPPLDGEVRTRNVVATPRLPESPPRQDAVSALSPLSSNGAVRPAHWASRGAKPRPVHHALAALLLGVFFAILATSAPYESPTIDEPLHLVRGLAYWWTGDTRLSVAHPPLANALAALPTVLTEPRGADFRRMEGWKKSNVVPLKLEYTSADFERLERQLASARMVIMSLAVLLGLYIYAFCLTRYGPLTALAALFFYCLHPTVIAHARLNTTDLPLAFTSVIAVGELIRYLERRRLLPLLTTSLALGAALCAKYSALFLIPLMLLLGGTFALLGKGRFAGLNLGRRLGTFAAHAAFTVLVTVLCVNAAYRFQRTGWTVRRILREPEPQNMVTARFNNHLLEQRTKLRKLPRWLPIPLPYTYVFGAASITVLDGDGSSAYFMGQLKRGSWFAYFPVLLIIKSPASVIVLLGLGGAMAARRRLRLSRPTTILLITSALYLGLAVRSKIALGVRHVLPIMPMLGILAARTATRLHARRGENLPLWRAAVGISMASAAGAIYGFPHYISYFNLFSGGERGGHFVSLVGEDWGQDIQDVGEFIRTDRFRAPLYYFPYTSTTTLELTNMGIEHTVLRCRKTPPPPARIAVHIQDALRHRSCYPWLKNRKPYHTVNYHVAIYHLKAR